MQVSAPNEEAELADLERRRLKALVDADIEAAEDIHADNFQLVTPSGSARTKSEYLGLIERARSSISFGEPLDIDVRIHGDAGCLRYRSKLNIVVDGFEVGQGDYWHTDYYEKRRDRWQVVFLHATAIALE